MRYRAIRNNACRYPIRIMTRALNVSAAGYYAWRDRPESTRAIENRTLTAEIRAIHRQSRETYGRPSIWEELYDKRGRCVGENRVARLMRRNGIRAKTVKKWKATTDSAHRLPVAANTLDRPFTVNQPDQVWAGDISYVWTDEGWLYLAVVLDLYSRAVIGWAMGSRLTASLATEALTMALWRRKPGTGLLHHSVAVCSTPVVTTSAGSPMPASRAP